MMAKFIAILFLLFPLLYSYGQVIIRGQVNNAKSEKVFASIYQYGSSITGDFNGDFEMTIDSLGGFYFIEALGYETKKVIIQDSNFLLVTLKETKQNPRKIARSMKRERKARQKLKRQMRKGKIPIHGGCCFVSGTIILMGDGTQNAIENLIVGDAILTYDLETETIKRSTIQVIDELIHDNIIEIELENGKQIQNTSDHPYYVFGKGICSFDPQSTLINYGIEAKQLQSGDECYSYVSGEILLVKILNIKKLTGTFITYNISEISNNNNYFVNGILVNNEKVKIPLPTKPELN